MGLEPIAPPSGSRTEERSVLLLAFSFMVLFFGVFLLIPAFFIQSWIMFYICMALIIAGILMLTARYLVLRKYSKKIEIFREEVAEKAKCPYCGSMNSPQDEKCIGCGAPL